MKLPIYPFADPICKDGNLFKDSCQLIDQDWKERIKLFLPLQDPVRSLPKSLADFKKQLHGRDVSFFKPADHALVDAEEPSEFCLVQVEAAQLTDFSADFTLVHFPKEKWGLEISLP